MTESAIPDAIEWLLEQHSSEDGGVCVLYGSRAEGRDLDLLLLQESEPSHSRFHVGRLDILAMSFSRARALGRLRDPLVMEPILTGDPVAGNPALWTALVRELSLVGTTPAAIRHLVLRSLEETLACSRIAGCDSGDSAPNPEYWSYVSLSFAIAYLSFAQAYASGQIDALSLETLIRNRQALMPGFWRERELIKSGDLYLSGERLESWISRWVELLVKQSSCVAVDAFVHRECQWGHVP